MICKVETKRFIIEIIPSQNWKQGKPINPKIPKWLVKVTDKFTQDEYFPNDNEFRLLASIMEKHDLLLLSAVLKIKEHHNFANLKNPEKRPIECHIHNLVKEVE